MTFSQETTSFRLQNGDEIPDTDQCIILVAFFRRERSFGAFVGQFFDPPLHLRVGTRRTNQSDARRGSSYTNFRKALTAFSKVL